MRVCWNVNKGLFVHLLYISESLVLWNYNDIFANKISFLNECNSK